MDWERINIWTNTLYALIQSLHVAKQIQFGNLPLIGQNIKEASTWVSPECSYSSVLCLKPFGNGQVKFRRDPNAHFEEISAQVVKMLIEDLVVIMDQMMADILATKKQQVPNYPQGKVEALKKRLDPKYQWASNGCLELIAVRNVQVHCNGRWNAKAIKIIEPFVVPPPNEGDRLSIGFSMLFRYRQAIRTFLNQVG